MSELIVLLGCVKSKREGHWPACQLYRGPLWEARWELARALEPRIIWTLSARYGAVTPNLMLESYDQQLVRPGRTWSERVWWVLGLGRQDPKTVLFLAGKPYRHYLAPWLRKAGHDVIEGLAHVPGHGWQIAVMRQAAELARQGNRDAALELLTQTRRI